MIMDNNRQTTTLMSFFVYIVLDDTRQSERGVQRGGGGAVCPGRGVCSLIITGYAVFISGLELSTNLREVS